MACAPMIGLPMMTSNSMMKGLDRSSPITSSDDLESFSFTRKEIAKQESFEYIDSHHILGVSYDNMQVWLSLDKERHNIGLESQAHESQPSKSIRSTTFNASNNLSSLSETPMDLGHPLDKNLTSDDPLQNLGFENRSVSSSMYGVKDWSSTFCQNHTYEKEQLQQVSCSTEMYASPSLYAHQKAHSTQLYQSPLAHKELDLHNNVPICIGDSYTLFKTKAMEFGGSICDLDLGKLHNNVPISIDDSYSLFKTKAMGSRGATLDASRYFSALKGPELETLKDSKHIILPKDKPWPFLLRFPISYFAINLGLGSQAFLWKILASQGYMWFVKVPTIINLVLWCLAAVVLIIISTIYALKVVFYFEAVRREFNHPIRINFFFAPWVACMLLALSIPSPIAAFIHSNIWIILMAPILALNLKVYGDWVFGGERHLCKVANPCTHLSLLGNFMGALVIATVGYMELALFFWSIGFVHYLVLLVTLYQRLPSAMVLPKELHPILFLFIALPSSASVSWAKMMGKFDLLAKILYFVAMFLFSSLVVKFKNFYGFRFNVAWWAYTFPFTISAIATIQYSLEVNNPLTQTLAALLIMASSAIVFLLAITTMLHTFVWKSMFPNDLAIAITSKGKKAKRKIKEIQEDILPSQGPNI